MNGIYAYSANAAPVEDDELLRTRDAMRSRGPDGEGCWLSPDRRVGLAHRRLAIIDVSMAGAQPMWDVNGRYVITFNGEIYNYASLRADLIKRGARLRSQSDTEVLLAGYALDGPDFCRQLRGMYAFAIWDTHERRLFMARDAFGIKPLYVHENAGVLRFASQVKALLAGGAISAEVDLAAEYAYWVWGHVPEPMTFYRGITAHPPGTWRIIDSYGRSSTGLIESVSGLLSSGGFAQARSLKESLMDSVKHHLVADVPVGIFLSAGVDSSVLATLAAEQTGRLRTLTLGFEEFRGTAKDETVLATKVAERCGTQHETVWISRREFEADTEAFFSAMDQPTIDGLNTWLVAKVAAQQGIKVALSGVGGDEFFKGYPSFEQIPKIVRHTAPASRLPWLGRGFRGAVSPILTTLLRGSASSQKLASLLEYGHTWEGAYLLRRAVRMPWELSNSAQPAPVDSKELLELSPTTRVSYLESTRYMRNQLLRDTDWAGMAHSVEVRVPFVDRQVVNYIGSAAAKGVSLGKRDLLATASTLPPEIGIGSKLGFVVPIRQWLPLPIGVRRSSSMRDWQEHVAAVYLKLPIRPQSSRRRFALWAPEMASRGGVQSYMWRLWEILCDLDVGSPRKSRGLSLMDQSHRIANWINRTPPVLRPIGSKQSRIRYVLNALTRSIGSDLIVGHMHQAPVALIARILRITSRYHVVLHGIEAWKRRGWRERLALRFATSVVATTRYTADVCAHVNGLSGDNFRVIPLCAEPNPVAPRTDFVLSGEWPILFVGRLSKPDRYKGLTSLLSAVAHLVQSKVPVVLHVIGSGDDQPYYEEKVDELAMKPHVVFHGYVDDATLLAAYATAKVFVMPSAKEGFGIVFLEAMRAGVPCIGGAHGGTPEVVRNEQEGCLVSREDVVELRKALLRFYQFPNFAKTVGNAGKKRFEEEFEYSRFLLRWRTLIEQHDVQ